MKTKFILHGGFTKGKTEENNGEFYTEILKDAPELAKIYKGKVDGFGEGLESLLLPEYQYKVFEIIL